MRAVRQRRKRQIRRLRRRVRKLEARLEALYEAVLRQREVSKVLGRIIGLGNGALN